MCAIKAKVRGVMSGSLVILSLGGRGLPSYSIPLQSRVLLVPQNSLRPDLKSCMKAPLSITSTKIIGIGNTSRRHFS